MVYWTSKVFIPEMKGYFFFKKNNLDSQKTDKITIQAKMHAKCSLTRKNHLTTIQTMLCPGKGDILLWSTL